MTIQQMRRAITTATRDLPELGTWLERVEQIHPDLATAVAGIYCGRDGRLSEEVPNTNKLLVMGWHNGRVEYGYIS
jgi:hypothetical protein